MRAIAKIFVLAFSILISLVRLILGAHMTVLRNFASREAVLREQVKRD